MRYILKPTKRVSFLNLYTDHKSFSLAGSADNYGVYGSGIKTIDSRHSSLKLNENNLIILNITVDYHTYKPETFKIWLNPSSYSDLEAGRNANQVAIGNIFNDLEDQFVSASLDWGRSKTEGDELKIGTTLRDVINPVS